MLEKQNHTLVTSQMIRHENIFFVMPLLNEVDQEFVQALSATI